MMRPTWVTIDLEAIEHNVRTLCSLVAPSSVCAVVKADGYGHGAVPVARAALRGGATWLAVAFVEEGVELRAAGIDAPVLVLSEPRARDMRTACDHDLSVTVYSEQGIEAAAAASRLLSQSPWPVHLKVDTGMHRVGVRPSAAANAAAAIASTGRLTLESVWTHCAVADDPDDPFTGVQLARFDEAVRELEALGHHPRFVHAANSAGAIAHPPARRDLVRCGIAVYGIAPSRQLSGAVPLRAALSFRTEIVHLQDLEPGESVSYGRRWRAVRPTAVATLPVGYADGVRRSYGLDGGEVLVRGRRCPVIGVVTMDQLLVDVSEVDAAMGDEVMIIGEQGTERIEANDVADIVGTIGYEVTCAVSARVPRRYLAGVS